MPDRVRNAWSALSHSLGFIPGLVVALFVGVGVALVELDRHVDADGLSFLFQGDASAARTVLSVIAGSLITVAGLTFSITMVVLQLASSQFSPRVLRTFFADRVTQVTIGAFVGTFVYAILVLRAVGSLGDTGFVPRLSVTLASLLGMGAAVLLIVFLHHVSQMVQVSYVTAGIAASTLRRTDALYPSGQAEVPPQDDGHDVVGAWRRSPPGTVHASRAGYVQHVGMAAIAECSEDGLDRVAVLVCPGDFVAADMPIAETWPAEAAERTARGVRRAIAIGNERDLGQDLDFGLRQLSDIALKAVSPAINDPATAVTCIGYLRSVLTRLVQRPFPPAVRESTEHDITIAARQRSFAEYLEPVVQIGRHAGGDGWVVGEMLDALLACARAAAAGPRPERVGDVRAAFAVIEQQAREEARNDRDRARIDALRAALDAV